jgi:hypothetical protein
MWAIVILMILAVLAAPAGYEKATGNHVQIVLLRDAWTWPPHVRNEHGVTLDGHPAWLKLRGPIVLSSPNLPLPHNGICRVIHQSTTQIAPAYYPKSEIPSLIVR